MLLCIYTNIQQPSIFYIYIYLTDDRHTKVWKNNMKPYINLSTDLPYTIIDVYTNNIHVSGTVQATQTNPVDLGA